MPGDQERAERQVAGPADPAGCQQHHADQRRQQEGQHQAGRQQAANRASRAAPRPPAPAWRRPGRNPVGRATAWWRRRGEPARAPYRPSTARSHGPAPAPVSAATPSNAQVPAAAGQGQPVRQPVHRQVHQDQWDLPSRATRPARPARPARRRPGSTSIATAASSNAHRPRAAPHRSAPGRARAAGRRPERRQRPVQPDRRAAAVAPRPGSTTPGVRRSAARPTASAG